MFDDSLQLFTQISHELLNITFKSFPKIFKIQSGELKPQEGFDHQHLQSFKG
jgi:hypothetical protein